MEIQQINPRQDLKLYKAYMVLFCRVHVIFGHVIFGQELVMQIENLETDSSKSCPIKEVKVENCGELVPQMKSKGMLKRYRTFCCMSFSSYQLQFIRAASSKQR